MSKSNLTLDVEFLKFIKDIDNYLKSNEFISLTLLDNRQVHGKVMEAQHGSAAQLFHDKDGKVWDSPDDLLLNLYIQEAPGLKPVVVNFRDIHAWSALKDYLS